MLLVTLESGWLFRSVFKQKRSVLNLSYLAVQWKYEHPIHFHLYRRSNVTFDVEPGSLTHIESKADTCCLRVWDLRFSPRWKVKSRSSVLWHRAALW